MQQIKFSYLYEKMDWKPKKAKLMQCLKINFTDLSKHFITYDTRYLLDNGNWEKFPLPKGELILLILFDVEREIIWTTIRRFTQQKWKYYKALEGELFEVVLPSEN